MTVHYAQPSKKTVRVAYVHYEVEASDLAPKWIDRLLDRAYGLAKRRKRIKLLINPFGGTGKAQKLYTSYIEPIFAAARCEVDVERTQYSGHAVDIAERLDIEAYDLLASASGDGLPHECFNGLGRKSNAAEALRKLAVVQLPCGSGNALSWNLNGTGDCGIAALEIVKGVRTSLDLVSVTQGEKRTLSFLSSALGVVAESDLGTDNIRWMGDARFTYGILTRLISETIYPIEYSVKEDIVDKEDIKRHWLSSLSSAPPDRDLEPSALEGQGLPELKYGTINDPLPSTWTSMTDYPNMGNFYAGNLCIVTADTPFFPAALPSDGLIDLVTVDGDVGRKKSVEMLLNVPKGRFMDMEGVRYRKVSGLRVVPKFGGKDKGYYSVDGEKFPFEPFQLEVHRGLGTTLGKMGTKGRFEYEPGWSKEA